MEFNDLDADFAIEILRENGFSISQLKNSDSPEKFNLALKNADFIIAGYKNIDAEIMMKAPNLKLIATTSSGVDMVDVEFATSQGILVCNVPQIATEEVALHALSLILSLERGLFSTPLNFNEKNWGLRYYNTPRRLSELNLGLIGFGKIGSHLAQISSEIFNKVLVFDPFLDHAIEGITKVETFEDLLASSDVVSLHMPLNPDTQEIMDAKAFAKMRSGATFINVARGGLVNHAALEEAVKTKHLRYVGLDVLNPEPPQNGSFLLEQANVKITPHIGFASSATLRGYMMAPVQEILAFAHGEKPVSPVNTI